MTRAPIVPIPRSRFTETLKVSIIACVLALVLSGAVSAQSKSAPTKMPDVLVLVLSGMGSVDQVSINYSSVVSQESAKADIRRIANETAWMIGDQRIATRKVDEAGDRQTTSASFNTLSTVNRKEGLLTIAPFVTALKRFRTIELNYLVPQGFVFGGLKDFEDDFVKIHLEQRGSSYLYRIRVKDSRFDRLVLPSRQPKPRPNAVKGPGAIRRCLYVVMFALLCGLAAYFVARALHRKGSSEHEPS